MRVVAIDQGTTSTRAFVLDRDGTGEIVCARSHKQNYPKPGWVEHNPMELLNNVKTCLTAAGTVDAIGIANQGESCLAWDARSGTPISPVIVWQDRRTENTISGLKAQGMAETVRLKCGLPLDTYFSAGKMGWIMANIPQARQLQAQGHLRLGTTDAFFLDRLTGHFATDVTTASRTSLLNLQSLNWDPELCEIFGVPLNALPEVRPSMADFGSLELAGRQVRITANIVDQQASLFGHGCRIPGDAKITFGTGAFALVVADGRPAPDSASLPTLAWQNGDNPPVFAVEGGVFSAGSALNWARSLGLFTEFTELNQFENCSAISRNIAFVPALTGLGCPHWDGLATGMWIGMSLETTRLDLVQAVLEGIVFRTAEVLDTLATHTQLKNEISIDGGLSENPYFCQFLANVLHRNIVVPNGHEITALGAACMAAGQKASIAPRTENVTRYAPQNSSIVDKSLFTDAVSRARNWIRN